ncbi:MAG: DUF58 domain-containing protein [Candidatus Thermoplasmatota archaeon]|jgi:uncharacterized protein (DUF58 family)|nr:DUF58 domain-containing protein [Candidatus Thermoplasmatota archaeon]MEC7349746.1 DUF58 domain-containing protein [Candidatus Thermoplasmatota archaeon]MEC7493960.1 DUF58 domain-containing protein [Candidatus Thermoplasmatota archaeon]MEC7698144.1 DUF58 domain-containing protein [Candidatus Thermoplasmatota archaeon]MEC8073415.1 DUF58 domain-containing protein [Candidatus Thermoplasmatota archaeon]|tara:strand:- start:1689 stop:2933 length:1245 start_codon:yes stop_codon:yes gene_type:complete
MWSKKAAAVAGGAIFLTLAGLIRLNYLFISAGLVMLTFVVISSFLDVWMPNVKIRRETTSDNIFEDGTMSVKFIIKNTGLGIGFVEIYDSLPPQARIIKGSNYTLLYMKPWQEVSFEYSLKLPLRGHYHLGPVKMRVKDAFDLFYNERLEESIHSFSVFPQVEVLEDQVITSRSPKLLSGAMPLNVIGTGTEFYSLREFVPGDSLRSVNWKALAKKGKMMVNETVREDVMDVILLVDAREVSAVGGGKDTPLEMSCRAAATYAKQLLDERNNVALMVYGDSIDRVDLDRGEHHLFKILTALSSAKPQGNLKLELVMKDLLPHIPSGSPIILFSSLDDDHTIAEAFTSTISRGFTITTISPSSLDFEERMKRIPVEPLLIAKIERDNMISELRSFGLQVGDWKYGDNVNTALQEI